jgi:hypothetical protein
MTSTTPTEPALAAALDAVIMSAQHDMARTQTDFLGRMGQSLCDYQDVFDQNPDGDLGADVREEADEAILSLAGLALAQLLMLRGFNHRDATALSTPAARMPAGEVAQDLRSALEPFASWAQRNVDDSGWNDDGVTGCRERIVDWFGPSQFRAVMEAYAALAQPAENAKAGEVVDDQEIEAREAGDEGRRQINRLGGDSGAFGNDVLGAREDAKPVLKFIGQCAHMADDYLLMSRYGADLTVGMLRDLAHHTNRPLGQEADVEQIARAIDPSDWATIDHWWGYKGTANFDSRIDDMRNASMERARDAITAMQTHPPAAEPVGLRDIIAAIRAEASSATSSDGTERDPWAIGRILKMAEKALATPARTDDAGVGPSIQIIGGPCAHRWSAMMMTGQMSCVDCRQTRPMTATEVAQWTK